MQRERKKSEIKERDERKERVRTIRKKIKSEKEIKHEN